MGRITLITGGCRSGKSRYALLRAEQSHENRVYVATCPALDDEMEKRIARHQSERSGRGWTTLESPLSPASVLAKTGAASVIVDCLTLWVSNLLFDAEQHDRSLDESQITEHARQLVLAARRCKNDVFLVTNEVGWGIVPENQLARRFRDLAGRCNQQVAGDADDVILMVSGIAVPIKTSRQENG
ncbi:MAG: bifunctional adenosylcobinamide kinase/adenosylcobinamide-phosphate guanylyltransferase [Planctomycetes bacterium]|nr:bifunctional adenosylcobinamide kinase/adenosylcobinamide-phosphate guanylyltransferase [Planctomycetota bacterium]